ncbi:hypothetical protein GCM10009619_42080 [Williamsia maris]
MSDEYREMIENAPRLNEIGATGMRAGTAPPTGIASIDGDGTVAVRVVETQGPGGPIPLRVYTPKDRDVPSGIVLSIHAGGYLGIASQADHERNRALVKNVGCAVVAPDYRLAPEDPFPASIEDCWEALQWIAQGGDVGWDTSRIAVGGAGSAGNFAAVVALMARDAGGPDLRLQYIVDAPTDTRCDTPSQAEFADGYGLRRSDLVFVLDQYIDIPDRKYDWRVSPLLAASVRAVAPALVIVGEWDILRDEDAQYANRLQDAGVPTELHIIAQQGHFPDPTHPYRADNLVDEGLRAAFAASHR